MLQKFLIFRDKIKKYDATLAMYEETKQEALFRRGAQHIKNIP